MTFCISDRLFYINLSYNPESIIIFYFQTEFKILNLWEKKTKALLFFRGCSDFIYINCLKFNMCYISIKQLKKLMQ